MNTTPPILSAHDTLIKLLGDRSEALRKWIEHVKPNPALHTIIQLPVPGERFSSHYFLIEKSKQAMVVGAFGKGDIEAADYLARCPNILIQQAVTVAGAAHQYRPIRAVKAN
jgi:rRNA pseudouridine-1189 N-methylase Emg1 (Nep1/Mra1 family)